LKVIVGDVTDARLDAAMKAADPQIVVHMAAIAGIDTVVKSDDDHARQPHGHRERAGVGPATCTLERFVDFRPARCSVPRLPRPGERPWRRSAPSASPLDLCGEQADRRNLAHAYFRSSPARGDAGPFNVYGPGQVGEGAIHRFVTPGAQHKEIQIPGDARKSAPGVTSMTWWPACC